MKSHGTGPASKADLEREIAERIRAEEALRDTSQYLENLINYANAPIIVWDPEFRITRFNHAFERLTGRTAEEVVGQDLGALFPVETKEESMDQIRRTMAGERWEAVEIPILDRSGQVRTVLWNSATLYGADGKTVTSAIAQGQDITERKRMEEALRESESVLRSFFDAPGIMRGIVEVVDVDDVRHIADNAATAAFLGVTPEAMQNKLGSELGEPRDILRRWVGCYEESRRSGKPVRFEYSDKRGETRAWLSATVNYLGDNPRGEPRFAYMVEDISGLKQAEEALRVSTDWLGMAQQAAHAGFWDWDIPAGKLTWSDEMFPLFGLSRAAEASFDTWLGTVHPDDRTAAMEKINRSIEEKKSLENEFRILLPDGTERWVGAWGNTSYDAAGEPLRMSGICLDITERKRVEESLRENEELFKTLYQGLPISAVVFHRADDDFVIREYNPAAQVLTGGSMEKYIGMKASEIYRSRPDILKKFALAWETKSTQNLQSRYRMVSTGQDIFLNMTLAYVPPDRILVLSEDNTELRKYEWELRETSQYLENLINYANTPIIVWDPQFRITRFNRAFERLTGRTAGEVLGRDLAILFPSITMGESMEQIRRAMAGERWEAVEIPILHQNGEVRTVLWNSATLYGPDGTTVVSAIAQGQDITERKRMEEVVGLKTAEIAAANVALREEITQRIHAGEALERTMSLLKATFESTADGIISIDADGMVAGFNQNYVAMWNVPFALLQTPDLEAITRHMAAQLVDPEGFMATNSELLSHPGREFYDILELRDGRIFERDSRPQRIERDIVGRVWSYRDITERKRAEERVLASLNEKEVLLREIHHRVKNNLQLISGLLDLTRLRTQDPETLGVLTDMMLKIQTMAQIHTRLYESKRFDRVNMGRQIQDQITSLSQIYGQKDREILCETELADLYLPIDQAIPCALAVNEILSNAFKHAFKGRAHGFLRVMASQEDSRVRITVQDDGRGIPPDLDIARSRSLGLKLIRNLVENQLKGSLAIRRKEGTEVILEFPILTQEEEHVTDSRSG